MATTTHQAGLLVGGKSIPDYNDRVLRYSGLPWSGGTNETWAYRYFDAIESPADEITAVDVVAASALHPGLSRSDLIFFDEHRSALNSWLHVIPRDTALADSPRDLVEHLIALRALADGVTLTLLSKVIHRKRPHLVPLVDRHILDWYRPITGQRTADASWAALIVALQHDARNNHEILTSFQETLSSHNGVVLSAIRILDISIWMETAR